MNLIEPQFIKEIIKLVSVVFTGVYKIDNVIDFERNLLFKDYKINSQKTYLYYVALIFIISFIISFKKIKQKKYFRRTTDI